MNIDEIFDFTSFTIDREPAHRGRYPSLHRLRQPRLHQLLPGPLLHLVGGGAEDDLRP